ncbi:hypothetical protein B0H11DRAFT_1938753 [Mycena galericulata]|nr:hypothetical protein B0H11DRAFT_1938753 [Mycena galericulata]
MSYRMDPDIVPGIMREAGRAMAERLLPPTQPNDDYRQRSNYGRDRSRSPRSYGSSAGSTYSRDTPEFDSGSRYGRRGDAPPMNYHATYGWENRRGRSQPRYRDTSPPRPPQYWSPRRRSPSPPPRQHQRFTGPRRYEEARPRDRHHMRGRGRGRPAQRNEQGRDDELRRRALDSRPKDTWTRTIFPPDANIAMLDADRLPLFPITAMSDDVSDYGSDEEAPSPVNYASEESLRRARAIYEEEHNGRVYDKIVMPLTRDIHGAWAAAGTVNSVEQARHLLRWVNRGDICAAAFLRDAIVTRLGTDPTLPRTIGEAPLEHNQNRAMATFNAVTNGAKIPRARNNVAHGPPRSVGTPAARTALEQDDPMPRAPGVVDPPLPSYVGTSAPPNTATVIVLTENLATGSGEITSRKAMSTELTQAVKWYSKVPTSHWPRGMRVDASTLPETATAVPWPDDVRAWFTIGALIPLREEGGPSIDRARFLDALVRLLSVHGTYHRYAQLGEYVFDNLPFENYPFAAGNVSFSQVVAWMIQHGIALNSEALEKLESFARARRNHVAGMDVNTLEFAEGFPANLTDVASIAVQENEHWQNLRHAEVRSGATTDYPTYPAGAAAGLEASIHAPEVTMGEVAQSGTDGGEAP